MHQFSAKNPFVRKVVIVTIDPATGAETPLTTGPVTGFLSNTRDASAVAADGTLSANLVYIGAQPGRVLGTWMFFLPASVMTKSLLDGLFKGAGKRAFFVCEKTSTRRVVEEILYADQEMAAVAA